mmetsp:Transcript_25356/g.45742  ORF Transcript_25356/g.45742 Transcript_25356/m.45742 type:complete len:97 (-) Transcript_25356:701-991(-)
MAPQCDGNCGLSSIAAASTDAKDPSSSSKTIYDPATSEMGPRANNNSLRSGHLRDMALAPSRRPRIWPPPRWALAQTSTTTYDLATSEMWLLCHNL